MKPYNNNLGYSLRMQNGIYKYYLKVFSIILLISFLNVNMGLCGLVISNCESEETSCCCSNHGDTSSPENIEKECCCVIKEMSSQPAEVNQGLTQSIQKNILQSFSNNYTEMTIGISDFNKGYIRVLSFHSPPKEKIHILNSNFRI